VSRVRLLPLLNVGESIWLLDNGADCNATQGMNYRQDGYSCTLECAITIGDWGCMKLLLSQKPSSKTKHILNRIVNCGQYGREDAVRALLAYRRHSLHDFNDAFCSAAARRDIRRSRHKVTGLQGIRAINALLGCQGARIR
jgi:hypothetical protein